jgi:hypothetical protein
VPGAGSTNAERTLMALRPVAARGARTNPTAVRGRRGREIAERTRGYVAGGVRQEKPNEPTEPFRIKELENST